VSETQPDQGPIALSGLNDSQREAVLATDGAVLILAGAGSGKTRVITRRIAHLLLDRGVPAYQILAVTFTNKAAGELRRRIEELAGEAAKGGFFSTFHSFGVRLLRREAEAAGLPHDFVIYDGDDQLAAVREVLKRFDMNEKLYPPQRLLSWISSRKNLGLALARADDDDSPGRYAEIAAGYASVLAAAHAVDFDDLLLRSVALLERNGAVREAWQRRFRYILVDEYQDTNRTQYQLIRLLAGEHGNITVVGDEDQAIYSWRGADIQNILDFEADFKGARVLRLEDNYRSSQSILDAAAALVENNKKRKGKTLRAARGQGERVRLHAAADEFEEAAQVVAHLDRRGSSAILFRINAQSRLFEEALLRQRIPYVVVGGVSFYERREVKDVLAYLRLARNFADAVAFRRIVNVPARGIGKTSLDTVDRLAAQRGISPWDALHAVIDEALVPARAAVAMNGFRELMARLRKDSAGLTVRGLLERALQLSGYSAALAAEDSEESQGRLENLAELLSAAAEFEARTENPDLSSFLDQIALLSDTDKAKGEAPVVLMTLHSAKGLEFDEVFLAGLEEGLLPHSRSIANSDSIEEERRLAYVGMTRARERLQISFARSRLVFGQRRLAEPSRFVAEIPDHLLTKSQDARHYEYEPGSRGPRPAPAWPARSAQRQPAETLPPSLPAGKFAAGQKVRHPLFGVGTVLRIDGAGDELKLSVSFPGVGAKKLVARFAGLEVV
jgi:DNA helicase-2/ATP-dependent DNA helicase PcrA